MVPVLKEAGGEVLVEKIDLPTNIRKGQPFEARIVVDRQGAKSTNPDKPVSGRLSGQAKSCWRRSIVAGADR